MFSLRSGLGLSVLLLTVTGCGPVKIPVPDLDPEQQAACDGFLADIPDPLVDLQRVETDPSDAAGRAYGDPPVVISCVDTLPPDFDEFAFCVEVNGVGWYLPDAQLEDDATGATFTAVGYEPLVAVEIPAQYRQVTGGDVLSDLTDAVKNNLTETVPCR